MIWIISLILNMAVVIVHICSIGILATTKSLLKNRFFTLALFLSVSDATMGIEYGLHTIIKNKPGTLTIDQMNTACSLLKNLIAGTTQFSILQTLLICIERLHASIPQQKDILMKITSNKGVGICFLFTHSIVIIRFILNRTVVKSPDGLEGCAPEYSTQKSFLIFTDTVNFCLVALIIGSTLSVIVRLLNHQSVINNNDGLSELEIQRKKKYAIRRRRNVITLICIVMVTVCSVTPRAIHGFYVLIWGKYEGETQMSWIFNNFLLINPLLDSFIYIFRIEEFRNRLKCKCTKSNQVSPSVIVVSAVTGQTSA